MGELEEFEIDSRIEKLIWRSIGRKSVRKMAEETGLPVEMVARIRTELLDGVDELTIDQKRTKLLVDLQDIADTARSDYDSADDTDSGSKLLTVAVGAIKTVLGEMRQIEKSSSGAIDALNQMRIRELMRLVDTTVTRTLEEVATTHDLELTELLGIFQSQLIPAARELDSR